MLLVYELAAREPAHATRSTRETSSLLAGVAVIVLLLIDRGAARSARSSAWRRRPLASADLWTRGGYGTVATRMIRDYPLTGVGIGSFNWMAADYWRRDRERASLPFDNAQNWWRHQVAELGLVAIAADPALVVLIAWLVLTQAHRAGATDRNRRRCAASLIGLGASPRCLAMPTQNPIVPADLLLPRRAFRESHEPANREPEPRSRPDPDSVGKPDPGRRLAQRALLIALAICRRSARARARTTQAARRARRARNRDYIDRTPAHGAPAAGISSGGRASTRRFALARAIAASSSSAATSSTRTSARTR